MQPVSEHEIFSPVITQVGIPSCVQKGLLAQDHGDAQCKISAVEHVSDQHA